MPSDKGYYEITVDKNKLTMEYGDKKSEVLSPLLNIDTKYKLISGKSYMVFKNDEGKVVIQ